MKVSVTREPFELDLTPMRACRIIGIDGDNGSGKTTLAREIYAALGGTVVSIDDFLIGNGQPYLSQLDFPRLASTIENAAEPIIVEGVLLQEVLQRLQISADFTILARCEHEDLTMYGTSQDVIDYYRRCSPSRTAQLTVTLRIRFNMQRRSAQ